jgi:glycosyltransferase A (GT-A) superfamily protein (DUF2064 family)
MRTEFVLQMTIEVVERQGLCVRLLTPFFDVDELPELQRLELLLSVDNLFTPITTHIYDQ